jgi:hypothetical protein
MSSSLNLVRISFGESLNSGQKQGGDLATPRVSYQTKIPFGGTPPWPVPGVTSNVRNTAGAG